MKLLTLDQHSIKKSDRYKKPTCIGAMVYNYDTRQLEYCLAKEIILATGGASSLFPYSTHPTSAYGAGIAIAYQAGARLLNMEQIQFHPLGLFAKNRPCFPLPLELLTEGGKIHTLKGEPVPIASFSSSDLLEQFYDELLKTGDEHLWLDLTHLDYMAIKEKFVGMDIYCLNNGLNIVKDLLPIAPVVCHTCGGVAIDRVSQTSLQRLRAIGEVACSGVFGNFKDEALSLIESLTWAVACAEDIVKQINKLVYYFPDIREDGHQLGSLSPSIEEDWQILRHIMWSYVGIKQDSTHLKRGEALLKQLLLANAYHDFFSYSIEQLQLSHAIQTAQLISHFSRAQQAAFRDPFLHLFEN